MRTLLMLAFAVLAATLLSCSSSSGGGSPQAQPDSGASPTSITLASQPYTLQPGDEKFFCYTMTLPDDAVVTGFTPTYGNATHHILFAQTLALEPDGFSECNVLFKTTWAPLYVGGKNTNPLQLPEGTGMKLTAGTQILLQLHLLNASSAPITDSTSVTMQLAADPSQPYTPAGIYGLDDRTINIPPNATAYQTSMNCQSGKTMSVFALFGHMHKIGTHINVTRNGGEVLFDSDWDFDVQPTTAKSLTINPSDQLTLTCTYANTTSTAVTYGESTFNEMCAFVFYYTSYEGLDGCIQQ
jgi:hypothetical protein